ncbi:MAG: iron chelate uptake ABC transporter family permease subunit, partial [Clostridia bacterium]|nr:iron chelate uptake ABC transporter family permease subunit [Clostridia bacterium]
MSEKRGKILRRVLLPLFPVVCALAALCIGRMGVTPADLGKSVFGHLTGGELPGGLVELTLWRVRLPRILLAMLTGAGLSASGCAFQSLFANP